MTNASELKKDRKNRLTLSNQKNHSSTCTFYYRFTVLFIFSELILSNVHIEASGEWECVVSTGRGNASRNVEIVVLENSASFCLEQRVTNNRGEFR